MTVYADNAATTKMNTDALEAMVKYLNEQYGNPSSLYSLGQKARETLTESRENIAGLLNCRPSELTFTSGGSEANNQAIATLSNLTEKLGKKHIITSKIEHHSVLKPIQRLENKGFKVTYLTPRENGIIDCNDFENAITKETGFCSIMMANNEIGTIQPINDISRICKQNNILFHSDTIQSVGHLKIDIEKSGMDLITFSAHKFNGPKGIGGLYCKSNIDLFPIIEGGNQERGKRSGTENPAAVMAMSVALGKSLEDRDKKNYLIRDLKNKLLDGLIKIPNSYLNGDLKKRLPGNINISFDNIDIESLLFLLDKKGIYVSSGSACTSMSLQKSHVLLALGLNSDRASNSLRLSINEDNTEEEIDYLIKEITNTVEYLRDSNF